MVSLPARALVAVYDFTGIVSNTVLVRGQQSAVTGFNAPSSWVGQAVSGSIRIDFDRIQAFDHSSDGVSWLNQGPRFNSFYSAFNDWIDITLRQPDGTVLDYPTGPRPVGPQVNDGDVPDCAVVRCIADDANATLSIGSDEEHFQLFRSVPTQWEPTQGTVGSFSMYLASNPGHSGLIDSLNYLEVDFNVALANWFNTASVNTTGLTDSPLIYGFTVTSMERSIEAMPASPVSPAAPVPEPSTAWLALAGLAVVGARHRIKARVPSAG